MIRAWQHFKTITHHRHLVMLGCFRVGLIWRGLTHDLSKYTPTEFLTGVRYYQGSRSPNAAEREQKGYSEAWMHHKGRNRHHFEYWTDLSLETLRYEPVAMPTVFLVEMVMDRIAACKTYQGAAYTDASPLEYLLRARESGSVLEAVKSLPENYRNTIYLHYDEGYSAKEIGKILDAKPNTVLSWLSRGRAILKEEMIGGFDDE